MKLICTLKNPGELIVHRVLGASGELVLTDTVCGLTLSELSPYAFSDTDRGLPSRETLLILDPEGLALDAAPSAPGSVISAAELPSAAWEALLPEAVTGDRLLSLSLPKSVKKIGRYAFYNCSRLYSLSIYSTTIDLGQGLFTGCSSVRKIDAIVSENSRSCLYELLSEFRYPLFLSYFIETESAPSGLSLKYRLVFPEFYENSDENTPARITVRELHGSGLMYRSCFANTQFQIQRYDALFPYAEALEPEEVCAELALCRLLTPEGLHQEAAARYAAYLSGHTKAMASVLAKQYSDGLLSLSGIRALLSSPSCAFPRSVLTELLGHFSSSGTVALLPLLMELTRPGSQETGSGRKRHFEL